MSEASAAPGVHDVAICTRFAWPSVGGAEELVRVTAGQLALRGRVRVFAHRIEGDISWRGPLDRAEAFPAARDPETGVVTYQLRLRRREVVALAPLLLVARRRVAGGLRVVRLHAVLRAAERLHAAVAAPAFARQFAGSQLVHRFGGHRMALATVRAARRLGVPVVVTPLAHPGQWDDDELSAQAYREADLVVATSRADAQTYLDLGVPPEQVRICPLPSARIRAAGPPPTGFPIGHPVVLFLGARRAYKGADVLLAAAKLLAAVHPAARVAFVGPGAALALPLASNVLDVGEVSVTEREAWLTHAAIVCLPSSAESFGLVLSEAWSAGTAVVTSDLPVLAERVHEAQGGLAVTPSPEPLARALAELLEDAPRRRAMGAAGRAQYERTGTPEAYGAWLEATYAELRSRSPSGRAPSSASRRRRVGGG